ncbi:hypothetical protein AB6805_13915 [Chitinophaga sp. RCC_12]|uniref:hypothetical protein n=1 Tax=Chitinophaga sp. RCC_12 TaxID=3239226 RepID=UPI003525F73F
MKTDELQQQIRFQIAQLSARNGQADFEKLCLFLAKNRIHPNVLPATGPVQSGGDQGRDFETFHTYLGELSSPSSYFVASASELPVAFACSLERDPAKKNGKIEKDVQSILGSGSNVERIYFFSGEDIPVAKRHKVIDGVRSQYNVELEILDAAAISLQLTDGDVFWIAVQYLKIPSEAYPAITTDWYSSLLAEYKSREEIQSTYEEFCDVKTASRYIYKNNELKKDLLFWLPLFDLFVENPQSPRRIVRAAIYEKFVASLVGLKDVTDQEENIKNYFSDFSSFLELPDLEDAQVLYSFSATATMAGALSLPVKYFNGLAGEIEKVLSKRFRESHNVDVKAALLEIQANFTFQDLRSKSPLATRIERYVAKLKQIIKLLPRTNYYSVETLSDRVDKFISIILDGGAQLGELETIPNLIAPVLAKYGGKELVAQKLRTRAIQYLKHKETYKAIDCLHELKIKWFNSDSIEGSIYSCFLLADTYRSVDLYYAAKYYGLIGAFIAFKHDPVQLHKQVLRGLSIASDCDYASGGWLSYVDFLDLLIVTHYSMTKDFNVFDHDDMHRILYYPALIMHCAEQYFPQVVPALKERYNCWGFITEEIKELQGQVANKFDKVALEKSLEEQIYGRIFNDVGESRTVIFNGLGCNWKFRYSNDWETNGLAEELIAVFQILMFDFSETELYIIPTDVQINISLTDNERPSWNEIDSNTDIQWNFKIPRLDLTSLDSIRDHAIRYFVAAQEIIRSVSLLPIEKYKKIIEIKLKREDILGKVSFGRPYFDLYKEFVSEDSFSTKWKNLNNAVQIEEGSIQVNNNLAWRSKKAPIYSRDKEIKAINKRIDGCKRALSISMPQLLGSDKVKHLVGLLKDEGWLEWQILYAITMLWVNHKAQPYYRELHTYEDMQKFASQKLFADEREWYVPFDENILDKERLSQELSTIIPVTFLPSFDLEYRGRTPNGSAIVALLKDRFAFFEDGKDITIFR